MKKCSKLCSEAGTRDLQAARRCTRVKHAEKLNHHASCSIIGQNVQSGHSVSLRLGLATQSSREAKSPMSREFKSPIHSVTEKLTLRVPFSLQYKYPLYPRNIENF